MNKKLQTLIEEISIGKEDIPSGRRKDLDNISTLINQHLVKEDFLNIIVVCTHNSRRSQLGELWINALAQYFNIQHIKAFSGGMEATAFNYRMVNALSTCGFELDEIESGTNPKYTSLDSGLKNHLMFSKVYDNEMNPQAGFMAFMVCGHADKNCPIVRGMKYRIPLRYKDPKEFDDTDHETEAYSNKIVEVGREMYYLLDKISKVF